MRFAVADALQPGARRQDAAVVATVVVVVAVAVAVVGVSVAFVCVGFRVVLVLVSVLRQDGMSLMRSGVERVEGLL